MMIFDSYRGGKIAHCNREEEIMTLRSKQEKRSGKDGACFSSTMAMMLTGRERGRDGEEDECG